MLNPKLIEYAPAVEALAAKRLNAPPGRRAAWRRVHRDRAAPRPPAARGPGQLPPTPSTRASTGERRRDVRLAAFHVRGRAESMRARRMRRRG